jgi:hypothetical protein
MDLLLEEEKVDLLEEPKVELLDEPELFAWFVRERVDAGSSTLIVEAEFPEATRANPASRAELTTKCREACETASSCDLGHGQVRADKQATRFGDPQLIDVLRERPPHHSTKEAARRGGLEMRHSCNLGQ